jgi:hypothetical protein
VISSDTSYKPPVLKSSVPSSTPKISAQTTWTAPQKIDPSASIDNTLGLGAAQADQRMHLKSMDKAGVSRGKAQRSAAGVASAEAMAAAQNQAAQTQMNADKTTSQMQLDYQYGSELEAQKLAMIQHSLGQSDWSVGMARQMAAAKMRAAQLSGQLEVINAYV